MIYRDIHEAVAELKRNPEARLLVEVDGLIVEIRVAPQVTETASGQADATPERKISEAREHDVVSSESAEAPEGPETEGHRAPEKPLDGRG